MEDWEGRLDCIVGKGGKGGEETAERIVVVVKVEPERAVRCWGIGESGMAGEAGREGSIGELVAEKSTEGERITEGLSGPFDAEMTSISVSSSSSSSSASSS